MNNLAAAIRQATQATRAGQPQEATRIIQDALAGNRSADPATATAKPRKPLGQMVSALIQAFPGVARSSLTARHPAPADPLSQGSSFEKHRFDCAEGSRDYRVFVPQSAVGRAKGVLVMLHGCTQSPEDFAIGTGMNAIAEQHGMIVVYPGQSRGANMQSCWNWFNTVDQTRGRGESAIIAGLTQKVMQDHKVARDQTYVAGLSAGAAMAVILGQTHPDMFAAVGAHSGLPFGAANDVPSAFAAMQGAPLLTSAPRRDAQALVRTIVFHGTADGTVHPSNADRIADQSKAAANLQMNALLDDGHANGRSYQKTVSSDASGRPIVEAWRIEGLGHAWSGGDAKGSYADAAGPRASAEMVRFFLAT